MEKIQLKSASQELIFKNGDSNSYFDVLNASPANNSENPLGSLHILGHVKYENEDMGYLVSLISSLAKREYYSETSKKLGNSKASFEYTLKKLNEVLDDFFKNKKFNLNMGLVVAADDMLYISKIGKFKIYLGRQKEIIDILNNINLFRKDLVEEKEFSNIISGKIKDKDAIFAFLPSRSVSVREKQLKEMLISEGQDEFVDKIKRLSQNAKNFTCCATHINIRRAATTIQESSLTIKTASVEKEDSVTSAEITKKAGPEPKQINPNGQTESLPITEDSERPIIMRDISLAKRDSLFKKIISQPLKLKNLPRLSGGAKMATALAVFLVIFLSVAGSKVIFPDEKSKAEKLVINRTENDLKLTQTYLAQNNLMDARKLASTSLLSLSSLETKDDDKISTIKQSFREILDKIDLTRFQTPQMIFDYSALYQNEKISFVSGGDRNNLYGFLTDGGIVKFDGVNPSFLKKIEGMEIKNIFYENGNITAFNGSDILVSFDSENQKISQYQLEKPIQMIDSKMYEQNLYVTDGVNIYKYSGAAVGETSRTSWLNDILPDGKLIAVDGNIYILSESGVLYTYFRGKKEKEVQLNITPVANSALLTSKDIGYLIYIDPVLKKIMLFDKNTGSIAGTYKADNLDGIRHWSLNGNALFLLSNDQKIWELVLE